MLLEDDLDEADDAEDLPADGIYYGDGESVFSEC